MSKNATVPLLAAACFAFASASCATYLNSGQFGHDMVVPPPLTCSEDRAETAMVFASGSYARGSVYEDDNNKFVQAGMLYSRRRPAGTLLVSGQVAASGWYGSTELHERADSGYAPSVDSPFAFFGGSAQAGAALDIRLGPDLLMGAGLRGGIAYEDGPYRAFRASAEKGSLPGSEVVDLCPSGWTGYLGGEYTICFSPKEAFDVRLGLLGAYGAYDLAQSPAKPGYFMNALLIQGSVALRFERICVAAALNVNYLINEGLGLTVGYILP